MYEIKDKVILITGGAAGIGYHIVRLFVDAGAKYVAALDIDEAAGQALIVKLDEEYGQGLAEFIKCDITTEEFKIAYEYVINRFGYIDILINNAGVFNDSENSFKKSIEVNVIALITSTMKAYSLMRKDRGGKGGTIINVSSIAALSHITFMPIYGATKSAILHFTNCLGMNSHFSRSNVRLITVCFGTTKTELATNFKGKQIDTESEKELQQSIVDGKYPVQSAESAAAGLIEAFKHGSSASTWLVTSERPAEDISENIKKAYDITQQGVCNDMRK